MLNSFFFLYLPLIRKLNFVKYYLDKMKYLIHIVSVAVIALLIVVIFQSIMAPIKFTETKKERFDQVVKRLKDIRSAELAYKSVHKKFIGDFDTLINFVKFDSVEVEIKIGSTDDSLAVARGEVVRKKVKFPVIGRIFKEGFSADSLRIIPFSQGAHFKLGAGEVKTASGLKVKVFEASATNDQILWDLDKQELVNLNDERIQNGHFAGLKVGSLDEATNNAGNWE